jgi:hypothetical protein
LEICVEIWVEICEICLQSEIWLKFAKLVEIFGKFIRISQKSEICDICHKFSEIYVISEILRKTLEFLS